MGYLHIIHCPIQNTDISLYLYASIVDTLGGVLVFWCCKTLLKSDSKQFVIAIDGKIPKNPRGIPEKKREHHVTQATNESLVYEPKKHQP